MKKIYLYACFGLLAMLGLYGCTRDFGDSPPQGEAGRAGELTVTEAQAWFEDYAADFTLSGFKSAKTRGDVEPEFTPLWDQSRSFTIDGTPMVEVPLNVLPSYSYRARDSIAVAAMTDKVPNTMIYLLAQKDENEDVTYRVVHIVADSSYLAGDPAKAVEDLSVSKLSDFSGMVVYYDLTGTLLDGVVYKGGREAGFVSSDGSAPPAIVAQGAAGQTRGYSDGKYKCDLWIKVFCIYRGEIGDKSNVECRDRGPYYWVCSPIDDGSGDDQDDDPDDETPKPDPSEKRPCENIGSSIGDPTIKKLLDDLAGKTKGNNETGYAIYKNADGSLSFEKSEGKQGTDEVPEFNFPKPAESVLHSHFDGCEPIFTHDDCLWMFKTYAEGNMSDPETFFLGLVTGDGGYFLTITDMEKFVAFGLKFAYSPVNQNVLGFAYRKAINTTDRTDHFAQFLKEMDTGMTLTTTKKDFTDLKTKEYDPKTKKVKTKDC